MKIAFVPLDQTTIGELDISDDSPKCFKIVFSLFDLSPTGVGDAKHFTRMWKHNYEF